MVELEPVPAMTGTRPATVFTHNSTTARSSSCDSVEASPVVPQTTTPCVPAAICRSTSATNAFSSTFPLENGVTRAGMDPLNSMAADFPEDSGERATIQARDSADNHFDAGFGKRRMSKIGRTGLLARSGHRCGRRRPLRRLRHRKPGRPLAQAHPGHLLGLDRRIRPHPAQPRPRSRRHQPVGPGPRPPVAHHRSGRPDPHPLAHRHQWQCRHRLHRPHGRRRGVQRLARQRPDLRTARSHHRPLAPHRRPSASPGSPPVARRPAMASWPSPTPTTARASARTCSAPSPPPGAPAPCPRKPSPPMQSGYGSLLNAEDHYGRADMFLWRGDTASAKALMPRLTSDRKAVVEARIGLMPQRQEHRQARQRRARSLHRRSRPALRARALE